MSPRVLVLSLTAFFTLGCNSAALPVAEATPAPAPAAASARARELPPAPAPVPAEAEAPKITLEPAAQPPAPVAAKPPPYPAATAAQPPAPVAAEPAPQPAATATPAHFTTTQPTTRRVVQTPIVIVPTTSEASQALPTKPSPKTAADHFDAQLATLIRDELPTDPAVGIAEDDRKLLRSVIDSLASFRMTLRSGNALRQTKIAPLLDLSEKIRSEIPLSLPTLALCRSVQQFGVYDPFDPPRFTAGRRTPVVVYCEVDHFRSKASADGAWETRLTYEAVLYSDGAAGVPVISKKPTQIVDRCRNRRRDFFLADRMTLPSNLPVGKYVLKVTVIDQLANLVAEKTTPVLVSP